VISRARCLAVIVASPGLLETSCSTIEQLRWVNALCWAKNFAGHGDFNDQPIARGVGDTAIDAIKTMSPLQWRAPRNG
jgi:hypothetical protein